MGASQSREGLDLSDSDDYDGDRASDSDSYGSASAGDSSTEKSAGRGAGASDPVDDIDARIKSLKLKYPSIQPSPSPSLASPQGVGNPSVRNPVKLYLHVGGDTSKAKWVVSDKLTSYSFVRTDPSTDPDDDADSDDDGGGYARLRNPNLVWVLKIGRKVRAPVASTMQMKLFPEQRRVDFVAAGVWAIKFFDQEGYCRLATEYHNCLFENLHGVAATEESRMKLYGKDFIGWANPEAADDSIWEDAEDSFTGSPRSATPVKKSDDLMEEFEETVNGEIQSLALGALDNSFPRQQFGDSSGEEL